MDPAESLSCFVCVFAYLINFSDTLTYVIPEAQPTKTFIGNIAIDDDIRSRVSEDEFNNLEFFFLENKYPDHFSIDSVSSNLTVKDPMDREVLCEYSSAVLCTLNFEVAARSKINISFIKVEVTIELDDINDNAPTFNNPTLSLSVSESEVPGKSIEIDGATDLDSSNFSVKGYDLSPSNVPFRVVYVQSDEATSVNLVINGVLDRETVDSYSFELIAYDAGDPPLNGSITVEITVEDANDNKPIFEEPVYEIIVKENFPINSTILTVSATDLDTNENAEISYRISKQQSPEIQNTYEINATTGELYLIDHLVYVSEDPVEVKIEAVDNGVRPLSSLAIVKVTVEDSLNVRPEISLNLLSPSETAIATEYASIGTVVAYVKVTDNDGGRNGLVDCQVESTYFGTQGVELKEYKVIVISPLDREQIERHNVTVICHDYGIPRLTASTDFSVVVTDENDNKPSFTQNSYQTTISENNKEGYTIIQVQAKDADIGNNGNVSYYIDPEYRQNFTINANTGLITANLRFDRETKSSYEIVVTADDAGNPFLSSTASVLVEIRDENDNEPVFGKMHYEYFIPESELKETVLGKVTAEDKDDGGNGYVSYSLIGNYSELPFEVLPDGTVKTTSELDREKYYEYKFQVMAIDNGIDIRRSSVVNVSVYVTDINDNAPNIIFPQDGNFVKYITYMMPAKTQVMKIEAEDADYDKNGDLTYTIYRRNDTSMFELGRNGEIHVARRLTESDINRYYLDVIVSDQGSEPKSVSTRINIEVLAKNVTAVTPPSNSIDQQNIIIAVVVVVVTLVIAAAILVIIWVVRRHDMLKRKYLEGNNNNNNPPHGRDNDSGFSSNGGRKTPDPLKMFGNGLLPTTLPVLPTAPPTMYDRPDAKQKDVKFQDTVHVREKSLDSSDDPTNQNTVERHRLASLRLQQAFIQNHDKQWTSQCELNQDGNKDLKKQEDIHSDMSADTATYDSGIGGSVSDTGDMRLSQLQQLVRQSGRRGKPPHNTQQHPTKPPKIIARGRSSASDIPPERPPPLKNNPYKTMGRSPVQNGTKSPVRFSPTMDLGHFTTSSPTPCSVNQNRFVPSTSPTKMLIDRIGSPSRHSPSKIVAQDLLMYKKFQNGLRTPNGRLTVDESVDTTQFDDDDSTTSGSYYIDNSPVEDWRHPPVSDIYV